MLCSIPRPSKHEAALRQYLLNWATDRGLSTQTDAAGNLILRKPASPGKEKTPGIVLQGHLDMVCQKNTQHDHDFFKDPITPELEEGWIVAHHTTLGADNGIGVALALAILESTNLSHGPLEVLLTVDEEAGMGGVRGLQPQSLTGHYLINLDTEEWGQFYLGCAGGVDVVATLPAPGAPAPLGSMGIELKLDGLKGGHSGIDIHKGQANGIRELLSLLLELDHAYPIAVSKMEGGTVRNALPRSASAQLQIAPENLKGFKTLLGQLEARLRNKFNQTDPELELSLTTRETNAEVLTHPAWENIATSLSQAPYGVRTMSETFPDVVKTSNNLGTLTVSPGHCNAGFLVRSLDDKERDNLAKEIADYIKANGGNAEILGTYPGWNPRPDSYLLEQCRKVFQHEYGHAAGLQVIHAGLECGLIAHSHPNLEMISFGPDIRGAHAPGERVQVDSVAHCWHLLTAILEQLSHTERNPS